MDDTAIYGFPFPEATDSPSGATQIQALAEGIEEHLAGGGGFHDRGKSIVAPSQTTTSGTFTLLGTPDRVAGLAAVEDGLVVARFAAFLFIPSGCSMEVALYAEQPGPNLAIQAQATFTAADHGKLLYTTASGSGLAATSTTPLFGALLSGPTVDDDCTVSVQVRRTAGGSAVGLQARKLHAYAQAFE